MTHAQGSGLKADGVAPKTILAVMADLFSAQFRGPSWDAWRVFLAALFGLPMADAEAEIYRRCTGRTTPPTEQAPAGWMIIGRRGGKTLMAGFIVIYLACFRIYKLVRGERGVVMVISADRRQSRVCIRYILAMLRSVPMLERLIESTTKDSINLTNGITIECHTASFKSTRGYTVVAVVLDEIAFWPTDDAAQPDFEILAALRPAMATIDGALLLALSSPYARRGELWKAFTRHFGKDLDPVLVWKADTRTMNPLVPEHVIETAYAEDPASAAAEYGAEFRRDIDSFVSRDALAAVVVAGRRELPPSWDSRYNAFVDPAGGSGGDSFTMAIAHVGAPKTMAAGKLILDKIVEQKPPFSPEGTVAEFARTLRAYGITSVRGDRWAGDWPAEQFRKHGITYLASPLSKSEIYTEFLPLVNSSRIELLDEPRLLAQLAGLERKTSRGGRDSVDHGPGGHDDVCNVAAGALINACGKPAGAGFAHIGWI